MFTLVVHEVAWAKVQVNSLKSIKYRKSYSADIKMTSIETVRQNAINGPTKLDYFAAVRS